MRRAPAREAGRSALWASACLMSGLLAFVGLSCEGVETRTRPHSSGAPGSTRSVPDAMDGFTESEIRAILTLSPLPAVPADRTNAVADDPRAARLGQFLFYDTRLSRDGRVSCASCHRPELNWTDGEPIPAAFGTELRHVPTLWNTAFNRWFFWDGRADSQWAQALEPIENPIEHGATREQCVRVLRGDPTLRASYERLFGPLPPIADSPGQEQDRAFANVGKSIAAFGRRLVTQPSPFDEYVQGVRAGDAVRLSAISPAAKRGLKLFVGAANCRSCHHGPNFSDGEFHDTGIATRFPHAPRDPGRWEGVNKLLTSPFNAMGAFNDDPSGRRDRPTAYLANAPEFWGQFKTPTLRNVAKTAPYMHRGQLATLREVVEFYSNPPEPAPPPPEAATSGGHRHRAGMGGVEQVLQPLHLTPSQVDDLVSFLETLSSPETPAELMTKPLWP